MRMPRSAARMHALLLTLAASAATAAAAADGALPPCATGVGASLPWADCTAGLQPLYGPSAADAPPPSRIRRPPPNSSQSPGTRAKTPPGGRWFEHIHAGCWSGAQHARRVFKTPRFCARHVAAGPLPTLSVDFATADAQLLTLFTHAEECEAGNTQELAPGFEVLVARGPGPNCKGEGSQWAEKNVRMHQAPACFLSLFLSCCKSAQCVFC